MFHARGPSLLELLRQALSSTDRGYDLLAPKFEYTPFRTPDPVLEVSAAAAGEVDDALDVCCGTGAAMRHLRPYARRRLVGVDRSAGMLAEARARLMSAAGAASVSGTPTEPRSHPATTRGAAQVSVVRADALALPFREAFDLVTCFGAFGHILEQDEERFVRELAAALRPGGRFVFVTTDAIPAWHPAWWMAKGFNAAMRIRNALIKPEFIMYYLTFLLPRATALLEAAGFRVEVRREVFDRPFRRLLLVVATKERG